MFAHRKIKAMGATKKSPEQESGDVSRRLNLGFWKRLRRVSRQLPPSRPSNEILVLAQIECDAEHNFSLCYPRVGTITRPNVFANNALQWADSLSIIAMKKSPCSGSVGVGHSGAA